MNQSSQTGVIHQDDMITVVAALVRQHSLAFVLDCVREACWTMADVKGPKQDRWDELSKRVDALACLAEDYGLNIDADGKER